MRPSGVILDLHREALEICTPLGFYAASSGYLLPTFRFNLSVSP